MKNKIPCENCICLPVCVTKVKKMIKLNGNVFYPYTFASHVVKCELLTKCTSANNYSYTGLKRALNIGDDVL